VNWETASTRGVFLSAFWLLWYLLLVVAIIGALLFRSFRQHP
jgi:hypothetical protein